MIILYPCAQLCLPWYNDLVNVLLFNKKPVIVCVYLFLFSPLSRGTTSSARVGFSLALFGLGVSSLLEPEEVR